jgi:hypothetical protein
MTRKEIIQALTRTVEHVVGRMQLRVYEALVEATPIDTGFAKAGWVPSIGAPLPGPPKQPARRSAAIAQAARLRARHRGWAYKLAAFYRVRQGRVIITNVVEYLPQLNRGSSTQAPSMFIEQAALRGVKAAVRDLRGLGISVRVV